jgi:UDP-N-acetylmuramoyl-L-alanyl-D-glutamate--2,6-diaminopimelate ligase
VSGTDPAPVTDPTSQSVPVSNAAGPDAHQTAPPGLRPAHCPPYPAAALANRLGARDVEPPTAMVSGITLDSRAVRAGDLYVGLPGTRTHGARFAAAASAAGAAAILTDAAGAELIGTGLAADLLIVDDPRAAMATAAAEIYQRPAEKMIMLGVTGTAGKTTTAGMLAAGLSAAGRSCGLIGTLGYFLNGDQLDADRTTITTPESPDLQALLAVFAENGAQVVAMEVSSHALALGRVDEICFDVAGFTNFSRDHLDFHGTEQAYFEAKAELFTARRAHRAVINTDDPRGIELVDRSERAGLLVSRTSTQPQDLRTDGVQPDYRCLGVDPVTDPATVELATPSDRLEFRLGLPGRYNVANALIALAMLDRIEVPLKRASSGLADVVIPGRLQPVGLGHPAPRVFVDFAHTPQAVGSVLAELGNIRHGGRLVSVLGCGGERDPGKRRPMGAAAAAGSDVVIVTDDNPRGEDPAAIRAEVAEGARAGATRHGRDVSIVDGGQRRCAIRHALALAAAGDIIAVLGKGHEPGQEIAGQMLDFDDAEEVTAGWQQLSGDHHVAGGSGS